MAKKDHSFSWIREGDINSRDACARRWKKEQKNLFAAERVLIKSREDIVLSIGEENTKHNIVEEGKRAERAIYGVAQERDALARLAWILRFAKSGLLRMTAQKTYAAFSQPPNAALLVKCPSVPVTARGELRSSSREQRLLRRAAQSFQNGGLLRRPQRPGFRNAP